MSDPYKHLDLTPEYNRIITATTNIRDEIRLVRKRAENPDTGLVSSWVMNDLEKAQLAVSLSGASGNKAEEVRKLIETPEPLNGGIGNPAEISGEDGVLGDVEKQREYYLEALGLEIDPEETRALLRVDGKFYWEADGGVSEDEGEVGPIKQITPYSLGEYLGYKSMDAQIGYSTAQPTNAKKGPGRVVDIADKTLPNKRWPAPRPEYKSSLDIPNLLADLINPITGAIVAKSILQQKQEAVNAAASPASANPLQSLGATAAKELVKQLPDFAAMTTDREFGLASGYGLVQDTPASFRGAPDMVPFIGSTIADEGGVPSWVEFPQYQYEGYGGGPYVVHQYPNFMGQGHNGPHNFNGGVPVPYNGKVYSYPVPLDGQFVNRQFTQPISPPDSNPVTTMSLINQNHDASYIAWFSATPGGAPHPSTDGVPLVMLLGRVEFTLRYYQAFSLTDRELPPKAIVFPIITKTYYFNVALVKNETVGRICNSRVGGVPSPAPRAPRPDELVSFDPTEIYDVRGDRIPIIGGSQSHPNNNPPQPESGPNYVIMLMAPRTNRSRDSAGQPYQGIYDLMTFQEYVDFYDVDTSPEIATLPPPTDENSSSPFTDLKTLVGSPALGQFTNVAYNEEIIALADENFPDRAFTAIRINESELMDFHGLDSFDDDQLWRMAPDSISIIDSKFTAFGEARSFFAENFINGRRHKYKLKYGVNGETPSTWKEEQFQGERYVSATGTPYRLFFIYTLTTPKDGSTPSYQQINNVSMEGEDGTGLGPGSYNGSYDMLPYQSAPNPFNYTIADGTGGSPNLLFSDSSWIVGTKPFNGNSIYSTDIDHPERLSIPFTLPYVVPSDPTNRDNLDKYGTFQIGSNRAFQGTPLESFWVGIAWISETPGGTPIATPNGSNYKFFSADAGQFERLFWSGDPGVFDGTYGGDTSNNILNAGICNTPGGELRFFNTAWVYTSLFNNPLSLSGGLKAQPGTSTFESYIIPNSMQVLVDKMIFSAEYPPSSVGPSGLGNSDFGEKVIEFVPRESYNDRYTFLGDTYSSLPNPYGYNIPPELTPSNIVDVVGFGRSMDPIPFTNKMSIPLTVPPVTADDNYSEEKFAQYGRISWSSNTFVFQGTVQAGIGTYALITWVSATPGGAPLGIGRNYDVSVVNTNFFNDRYLINDTKYWQAEYDYFDTVNYPLSQIGNSVQSQGGVRMDLINPTGDEAEVRFVNFALVNNDNTTFTDRPAEQAFLGQTLAAPPGSAAFNNFIATDAYWTSDSFSVTTGYPDSYITEYTPVVTNIPTLFVGEKIDVQIAKYTDFFGGFFTRESVEAVDYLPWQEAKLVPYSSPSPTFTPINGVYFSSANTLVPNPDYSTEYPAANIMRYMKFGNNFVYQIGFQKNHNTDEVFKGTFEPATRLVIGKDETVIINQEAQNEAEEEAGPVKSQDTMLPYLGEAWSNQVPQNVRLSTYGGSRYPDVTEGFVSPDIGFDSLEPITTDVPRAWYLPLDGKILVYPFSFGKENINTDFQISLKTPTQGEVVTNTDGAGNQIVPVIWISSIPGGAPQTNVAGVPVFITGFDTVLKCQQCFDVSEARTDTMLFPVVTKDYYINTAMVMESTTLDWALDPTTFDVNRDNLIAWQPEDAAPIAGSDNNQLGVLTLLTSALEPLTDFLGDSTTGV